MDLNRPGMDLEWTYYQNLPLNLPLLLQGVLREDDSEGGDGYAYPLVGGEEFAAYEPGDQG